MPRPPSMQPTFKKEPQPKLPCTEKRGFAHHWKCSDPDEGKVVMRCRYCRRKKVVNAGLTVWETWAGTVVIPTDMALRRTFTGVSSMYL